MLDMNKLLEYENIFYHLTGFRNFRQKGLLFHTANSTYFFDSGTGKTFECDHKTEHILKQLLDGKTISQLDGGAYQHYEVYQILDQLIELINQENLLKMPIYKEIYTPTDDAINDQIEHELSQAVFELTQKCNLRCKYCIYNEYNEDYRTFSPADMSWEILREGLDYIANHSGERVIIGFYGGEPLIKFNLIKKAIEYYEQINRNKEVVYTITTNLTLMTDEIASYLVSVKNMKIVCSFDGPEDIQNKFRVFEGDLGSFNKALNGLKLLAKCYKENNKEGLAINMVICPPYTNEKFEHIKSFFESLDLPNDTFIHYNYVEKGTLPETYRVSEELDYMANDFMNYPFQKTDPMKYWAMNKICNSNNKDEWFLSSIEKNDLVNINTHYLFEKPANLLKRNGCCTPCAKRLYITVEGDFHVCERVGEAPSLGSLSKGVNLRNIKTYFIKEYDEASMDCHRCWASHLCNLCYASCMKKDGIDQQLKIESCHAVQVRIRNCLIEYYQILECNPDFLDDYIHTDNND